MKYEEIVELIRRKIASLEQQLQSASLSGDVDGVVRLESEIEETKRTLEKLGG